MNLEVRHLAEITEIGSRSFNDQIAFCCQKDEISYSDLNRQANQLANALVETGLNKGDRVGILLERSIQSVISVYGILRAGGVFVPLDPSSPAYRINSIIKDCSIKTIITSRKKANLLDNAIEGSPSIQWILGVKALKSFKCLPYEEINKFSSESPGISIDPQDNAYIMFTSGTTGKPKGIVHTHSSGLSYARLSSDLYQVSTKDCIGIVAALHFDQSTFGYFTAPLSGAKTVLFGDMELMMPGTIANIIINQEISILYSVPQFFIQLIETGLMSKFHTLKWIHFGGEPFQVKYINELIDAIPEIKISNIYGPAEVNQCTYHNISEKQKEDSQIPIGKPWGETDIKIFDENDHESKHGPGELLIHSPTMMKGYWNKDKLNKKVFYIDPVNNKKYYRSGDLVRADSDGQIYFIGREDHQVKIRGFRIELEEIQHEMDSISGLKSSAVIPVVIKGEEQLLAVYCLVKDISQENIRKHLISRLPKYSVPKYLIRLNELPRTKNGKLDRELIQAKFSEEVLQMQNT